MIVKDYEKEKKNATAASEDDNDSDDDDNEQEDNSFSRTIMSDDVESMSFTGSPNNPPKRKKRRTRKKKNNTLSSSLDSNCDYSSQKSLQVDKRVLIGASAFSLLAVVLLFTCLATYLIVAAPKHSFDRMHWTDWTEWTSCEPACGKNRFQKRKRVCDGGNCTETPFELNAKPCAKKVCRQWQAWQVWSSCSAVCGNGTRHRTRLCGGEDEDRLDNCPGGTNYSHVTEECFLKACVQPQTRHWNGTTYYFVFNKFLSWTEATVSCHQLWNGTGRLSTVLSGEENQFIYNQLKIADYPTVWLAGSDSKKEGHWVWASSSMGDGSCPIKYSNWIPKEPSNIEFKDRNNGTVHEDCLQMRHGHSGQWNDEPCRNMGQNFKHNYVCKLERPNATTICK